MIQVLLPNQAARQFSSNSNLTLNKGEGMPPEFIYSKLTIAIGSRSVSPG